MAEMLQALHALRATERESFWDQRLKYVIHPGELETWEYAYTVIRFNSLPKEAPSAAAAKEASEFLKTVVKKKATKLEQNLGFSMQAVNHVLTRSRLKSANWDEYRADERPFSLEVHVKKFNSATNDWSRLWHGTLAHVFKDSLDVCVYEELRPEWTEEIEGVSRELDQFRIIARQAASMGCGNCKEHSILAFMHLHQMGVRPIDHMSCHEDHAFVVIGRQDGNVNDWKNWGDNAVVCDPWTQGLREGQNQAGTYPGKQYGTVMGSLLNDIGIKHVFRVKK